jgi:type IV pilus assembly protein PilV
MAHRFKGFTLIEVLVALLILVVGLLGAAALQLNALKYTDSSTLSSKASFIAYDMMDLIRANPDAGYALANLDAAPTVPDLNSARTQDLYDFASNVRAFAGPDADGSIVVNDPVVTINIIWTDSRAEAAAVAVAPTTYTLTSRVAIDKGIQ